MVSFNISELVKGASGRMDLWGKFLLATEAASVAEIGVWKGDFSKGILESCDRIEKYFMIDPWATLPDWNKPFNVKSEVFDQVYAEAMEKTDFAGSRRITLRGRTSEVIDGIPDGSLDFAYIDGDHTLRGITIDLVKVLPKIRDGGFIGGDDFINNPWQHDIKFEPSFVCPFAVYFSEAFDLPITALPFNQFLIQKNDAGFSFMDTTGKYQDLSLNRLPSAKRKA